MALELRDSSKCCDGKHSCVPEYKDGRLDTLLTNPLITQHEAVLNYIRNSITHKQFVWKLMPVNLSGFYYLDEAH